MSKYWDCSSDEAYRKGERDASWGSRPSYDYDKYSDRERDKAYYDGYRKEEEQQARRREEERREEEYQQRMDERRREEQRQYELMMEEEYKRQIYKQQYEEENVSGIEADTPQP